MNAHEVEVSYTREADLVGYLSIKTNSADASYFFVRAAMHILEYYYFNFAKALINVVLVYCLETDLTFLKLQSK